MIRTICLTLLVSLASFPVNASPVYWNLLNAEGTVDTAVFVTYHSLPDMLNDENRVGSFTADGFSPFTGSNIVGTGSDGTTYWNLFNTAPQIAAFVTYSSPLDMFNDENRLGIFVADGFSPAAGALIVGTGSDGIAYWNLFNAENETAAFVTYSSRLDMLNDENRLGCSCLTASARPQAPQSPAQARTARPTGICSTPWESTTSRCSRPMVRCWTCSTTRTGSRRSSLTAWVRQRVE